jgi:hypothetical protein
MQMNLLQQRHLPLMQVWLVQFVKLCSVAAAAAIATVAAMLLLLQQLLPFVALARCH